MFRDDYSSVQGRFTGVDPKNAGADVAHPQTWNGYSYSLNNPLRFLDPDGERWVQYTLANGAVEYQWFDDKEKDGNGQTAYDRALAVGWSPVTFDESKSFSFTNGLYAPGEVLTTITLGTDGKVSESQRTVGWLEWGAFLNLANKFPTGIPDSVFEEFLLSRFGEKVSGGVSPIVPGAATGITLTPAEARKLGNLAKRAEEKVGDVIRSRGGNASNVRQVGPWADKTLGEAARAAVKGDASAETAVKVAKQASRLGQK